MIAEESWAGLKNISGISEEWAVDSLSDPSSYSAGLFETDGVFHWQSTGAVFEHFQCSSGAALVDSETINMNRIYRGRGVGGGGRWRRLECSAFHWSANGAVLEQGSGSLP